MMDRISLLILTYAQTGSFSFGDVSLSTDGRAITITPDFRRNTIKLSVDGGASVKYKGHSFKVESAVFWVAPKNKLCIQPDIPLMPGFLEPVIRIDLSSLGV